MVGHKHNKLESHFFRKNEKSQFLIFQFLSTFNSLYCVEFNPEQLCQSYFGHLTLYKKVRLKTQKKNNFIKFNFKCTYNTPNCVELNSEQLCHSYLGHLTHGKKIIQKKPKKN